MALKQINDVEFTCFRCIQTNGKHHIWRDKRLQILCVLCDGWGEVKTDFVQGV